VRVAGLLLALAALALLLRAVGLGGQVLTSDDLAVGVTAHRFVAGGWPEPTMWNHPRLRDLLVRASLAALGDGPWGLKLWSVLLGAASVPAIAALVLAITGSLSAAAAAGLLLAVDPLHLDFSRQAINDVYLAFFPVAAVLAALRYRDCRRPAWLALAGLLLGLGVSSKWGAAFPVGAAGAVVAIESIRARRGGPSRGAEVALFLSCLVVLPLTVYLLTFAPWFSAGHDLGEWARLQRAMAFETTTHTGYPGTKLPGFPGELVSALRWFAAPIWYIDYVPPADGSGMTFISGVGNPATWIATLPSAIWAVKRWIRDRDEPAGWLVLLFLASYLPFVLVPRPIWPNSAVGVLPFALALVGWAAARLHDRFPVPVRAWGCAALVLSALLWLPAMGVATPFTERLVRSIVTPAAFDPANRPVMRERAR
jgi:4-amino-4-deoxy-L-arabinose transferase-like glycosyltransferase